MTLPERPGSGLTSLFFLVPLVLLVAACGPAASIEIVGTIERDRVELTLDSDEPIVQILVEDGSQVSVGQVILRQQTDRLEANLAQRQAESDRAAGRLAELLRGTRQEQLDQARAELGGLSALAERARLERQRQQQIFDRGLGEEASLDNARKNYDNALANTQAQRSRLEELLNGATPEQLLQAEADLAAAEATVRQAAISLQRSTLVAPVAGTLDKVWFETGERPALGTRVAVILDQARTFARVYVPERQRARLTPGTEVMVRVDGIDQDMRGTVGWVSSDASFTPYFALTEYDRSRLSYLAEIDIANATHLPSGLPVSVRLD